MPDFGLICEGVTDHAILTNVLVGYFKNQREPDIHQERPNLESDPHGGWTLVIQYLRQKEYREAFSYHDYLIIQIDTDVSEDPGFDVPKRDKNGTLSPDQLILKVTERLKKEIGAEDWEAYGDKFIFAIAVEQLECWLLPLWFNNAKRKQIANCTDRIGACPNLRDRLDARSLRWISKNEKVYSSYDFASKEYTKSKVLLKTGINSPSLSFFINELNKRNITLRNLEDDD
ncbi:hypothetical protein OVA24_13670 [Luteolibacter sp. SL250]|uniref:hypothetical protein n=1 Tax=Luteolibacter sp. SL250 TaxID=2995170 RepID=UPI002270EA68|nr:hypothetical protein [Luteolibacter sp. SL250]WAC18283.1 hypothetical protein OVA24_13670 [Luteolibacter sp. SL250]